MPFVNVKITAGATREQKAELIEGITDLLVRVLHKNPASTHVVIEEVSTENWGISGRSVAALRAAGAPGISKK
jgi:4-oxalocrotonate tautomerase